MDVISRFKVLLRHIHSTSGVDYKYVWLYEYLDSERNKSLLLNYYP